MKIILYKRCKLTQNYVDVFYMQELCDRYLATLTSQEIEIADIYPKFNDVLILNNVNLLFYESYNYLKIEVKGRKIYAFVNAIEIINDSCIIKYSCDVWHTFRNEFAFRKGLLIQTREPSKYGCEIYSKLTDYISNDYLDFNSFNTTDNYKCLYVNLRLYNTNSEGIATIQFYDTFLVRKNDSSNSNYEECLEHIKLLIDAQTDGRIEYGENSYRFEIDNIYIFPHYISGLIPEGTFANLRYQGKILNLNGCSEQSKLKDYEFTIPADEKIVATGTFLNRENIEFNGNEQNIRVRLIIQQYSIQMSMDINGAINDITDMFLIEFPIGSELSEAVQLKKLNRIRKNVYSATSLINSVAKFGAQTTRFAGNIAGNLRVLSGDLSAIPNESIGLASTKYIENAVPELSNIARSITDLVVNNAKLYTTNYKTNSVPNGLINSLFGIGYFRLRNIINEDNVNLITKELGYKVSNIVYGIKPSTNLNLYKYDYIRFGSIEIYGCSTNVMKIIENILLYGTKMWYTEDIE